MRIERVRNSSTNFFFKSHTTNTNATIYARNNRNTTSSESDPVLQPTIIQQVLLDDDDDDDFQHEDESLDDDYFQDDDDYDTNAQLYVGDGVGGGGISLAGTWWDKEALRIAEEVSLSFDGDLQIYAFKTTLNSTIQLRIDKLSNKSGSPSMEDIEAFSVTYRARLDEAQLNKSIPENISLEVSSPGVERVVQIPHELDRFKDRPMYVKYVDEVTANGSSAESDGVFRLISFDMESKCCTWGLADVKKNREKAGKGRPLSRKQREWRLSTSFDSLRLVRLYSDI
nr:ribosome maturation factor rimp [Quercus suber]